MISKINVLEVITDHLDTLRDATGKLILGDVLLFFIGPLLFGGFVIWWGPGVSENALLGAIAGSAVFAGLLINVLVLIYSISQNSREKGPPNKHREYPEFVRQTFSNISFAILVALVNVLLLSIELLISSDFNRVLTGIIAALSLDFFLTLLMTLKRIHALIRANVTP